MNIQVGVVMKRVRRVARVASAKPRRRSSKKSSGILGKTFKFAGKLGLNLTHLASTILIGKL